MATSTIKNSTIPILTVENVNIDNLHGSHIFVASDSATGTLPTSLGGNRFLIISDTRITSGKLMFGIQMAIGFGSRQLAIRSANYNVGSWTEWRYV